MDKISDKEKLEWLTTTEAPVPRVMINTSGWKAGLLEIHGELPERISVPYIGVMQLRPRVNTQSLGYLDVLAPELMHMVLEKLTCNDLKALYSCSTGSRSAVLAFAPYQRLLEHAPAILSILKDTGLARSFTIAQIYKTFASTLCTTCGQFGGFVFLPSFSRCCLNCAETNPMYLPVSRKGAKNEYGVEGKKVLDRLPQLSTIQGFYSSYHGVVNYYTRKLIFFSRELIENLSCPARDLVQQRQGVIGHESFQAHQRYMVLAPLPCYIPQSASTERGLYCAGCGLRGKEHSLCLASGIIYPSDDGKTSERSIRDGREVCSFPGGGGFGKPCRIRIARDTLHDSRQILHHIEGCAAAQALLRHQLARLQRNVFGEDP